MTAQITQTPTPLPALSGADAVTSQRFEMKYLIDEVKAERIRTNLAAFMLPDKKARFGNPYNVSSLYLDSPAMRLFWSSNLGEKNRFKLRVRSYSDDPHEPLFCEIKRRMNGIVLKKRATIRREFLGEILRGAHPRPEMMRNPSELDNLHLFTEYIRQLDARPCLHVRYSREAWMSLFGDPTRITFDSRLACLPVSEDADKVRLNGSGWKRMDHFPVILEIKFSDSYPPWLHEFVLRHGLFRDSCAKYVQCIKQMAREGIWFRGDNGWGVA